MTLNRWISFLFLLICLIYGYTAFFVMDANLPPFMRHSPIWPSSFPKLLSICGMILAMIVLLTPASSENQPDASGIDYRKLGEYKLGQTLGLLGLMVLYALCLRPIGFVLSTIVFLLLSSYLLGERKLHVMLPIAVITAVVVWYLVQQVLGIFLKPLPWFLS